MDTNDAARPGAAGPSDATTAPVGGDEALLSRIDTLLDEAGIFVATELRDGVIYVSGEIDSERNRQAALDVATALAAPRGLRVEDNLDVLPESPETAFSDAGVAAGAGGAFAYLDPDRDDDLVVDPGFEAESDFTRDIGTTDSEEAAAEAEPYFPPTDPVVRPTADEEQLAVVGGFSGTSMDDLAGAAGFDARNDDDITQAVLRELAEDAVTTDLEIHVTTRNGSVRLRGEVPSLEDAENAEAVAGRVAGVQEVEEDLAVTDMQR